jgi:hypothetical protein
MHKMSRGSQERKEVAIDAETGPNDLHLHNDTIHTLHWDKISVKVYNKTLHTDKYLLNSIDGAASAGQQRSPNIWRNAKFRLHLNKRLTVHR